MERREKKNILKMRRVNREDYRIYEKVRRRKWEEEQEGEEGREKKKKGDIRKIRNGWGQEEKEGGRRGKKDNKKGRFRTRERTRKN